MSSRFTAEGDLSEEDYLKLRLKQAGFSDEEIPGLIQQVLRTIEQTRKECRGVN